MAEVVIAPVIETLGKELISLIPKMFGSGSATQELKESSLLLSDIVTLLNNLKGIKYKSYGLMSWYQDLNHVVEDLQELVTDLKEDMEQQRGILGRIKNVWKPDSTLKDELKVITTRIRHVYDREKILHHVETKEDSITKPGPAPADPKMFERESEKEAIFDLLKTPSSYGECVYDFISIVGMGGIGKTTLAQHVYNDYNVASFPVRAWCHVSTEFNQCELYRSIIEQQLRSQCHIKDSFAMEEKLRGKKFLIVIDDYRNESVNDFNVLRAPFIAAAPGSKFIVTTRNRAVVKRFTTEERIIDLGLLSNEDCWSFFCSGSKLSANSTSNLVTIAKEICEKCDGIPLAVAVMKGLVAGIDDEAGWRGVLDDLISGKISDVRSIIRRSYWDLPEHLKPCFSFCTIFPRGHVSDRGSTVDSWIYAGIFKCENQSREDEVGGRWFDEIVSRSLLTLNPCGYVMHDIIRGMGMEVSGETYGRWEDKVGSWEKIRHVSISKQMTAKALDNLKYVPKEMVQVRTLHIDGENYENDDMDALLPKWRHLRVLQMQNLKLSKLSKYLGTMKHLRKLEIRNIYDLKKMPLISKLNNLTEVDIGECNNLKEPLPVNLCNLIQLKRFSIQDCRTLTWVIPSKLGGLTNLTYLSFGGCKRIKGPIPPELGGLIYLTYLSFGGCRGMQGSIPPELGGLTNLTYLSFGGDRGIQGLIPPELGRLKNLTYLSFGGCKGIHGPIPLELGGLTNLTYLSFTSCRGLQGPIPAELGGLTNLTYLSFGGCIGIRGFIPPELGGLTNLTYLSFYICKGLQEPIPLELGDLTNLRCFSFIGCRGIRGPIPLELGGLTNLTYLSFTNCRGLLGSIPPELGDLTNLTDLSFFGCRRLQGPIPPELGGLTSLTYLSFTSCRQLQGPIPPELGGLTNLTYLSFTSCGGLTGPIPPEMGGLTALTHLSLDECKGLTGPIPSKLGSLTNLTELSFSKCKGLQGLIPPELGGLTALKSLYLDKCEGLQGPIPSELGGLTSLTYLNMNGCRGLTGPIPQKLEHLTNLR